MRPKLLLVALVAGLALGEIARAQQALADESSQQIARLIAQLDSDSFETREGATRELKAIGLPALAALQAARKHPSAEVRGRAKLIYDSLTVGVRRRELVEFAMQRDDALDLDHGMWLIARILNPTVKKADLSRQLDALAGRVRERLGKEFETGRADPQKAVAALRQVLFVEESFTGNVNDYHNPDNSSLERVLATKKGLPILLSHVTIAVARRAQIPIVAVPLSGTYIVKYDGQHAPVGYPRDDIFLHPFEAGKLIAAADLDTEFPGQLPAEVESGTRREALTRILRNLVSALSNRGDQDRLDEANQLLELLEAYAMAEPTE